MYCLMYGYAESNPYCKLFKNPISYIEDSINNLTKLIQEQRSTCIVFCLERENLML